MDKLDIPVREGLITEMCAYENGWITQLECRPAFLSLADADFIIESGKNGKHTFYSLTADGRLCLSHFHKRIPKSTRDEICEYIKANRLKFRKKQEFPADYYKNADGTYTVFLKILSPSATLLELKLNVQTRHGAKSIYNNWETKAPQVFELLHDSLNE